MFPRRTDGRKCNGGEETACALNASWHPHPELREFKRPTPLARAFSDSHVEVFLVFLEFGFDIFPFVAPLEERFLADRTVLPGTELAKRGGEVKFVNLPEDCDVNGIDDLLVAWGPSRVLELFERSVSGLGGQVKSGQ
jgi:hypothetical protein